MLVPLLILNLVFTVTAQLQNVIVYNPRDQYIPQISPFNIQRFVEENIQNTLQDLNGLLSSLTGHHPGQRIFVTNWSHQAQNIPSLRMNNFRKHVRIPQGSFGSSQHGSSSVTISPNMQVSIGSIIPRPFNPHYQDRITLHRPPGLIRGDLFKPPKSTFINRPLKNEPLIIPPHTIPSNTFAPEYVTPAPLVNEENNNKINDEDQDYDIDVRHEPS